METNFSSIGKNDREREGLKGPVRNVRSEINRTMDERNYTKAKSNTFRHVLSFLPNGQKAEEIHFNPDGTTSSRELYAYDDDGSLLERRIGEQEGPARMQWTYTYEDAGRMVLETRQGEDMDVGGQDIYYFDEKGRKKEERTFDTDGELLQRSLFHYEEESGRTRLTWKILNPQGDLVKTRLYLYDTKGNLLEKEVHSATGALESRETFRYDENGNVLESNHYQGSSDLQYQYFYHYQWDERGNWTEKKTVAKFSIQQQTDEFVTEICRRTIEYYS